MKTLLTFYILSYILLLSKQFIYENHINQRGNTMIYRLDIVGNVTNIASTLKSKEYSFIIRFHFLEANAKS